MKWLPSLPTSEPPPPYASTICFVAMETPDVKIFHHIQNAGKLKPSSVYVCVRGLEGGGGHRAQGG